MPCLGLVSALGLFSSAARADHGANLMTDDMVQCARLLDEASQSPAGKYDARKPTVVLIDGYSSGRLLSPALRAAGLQVLHVHATGGLPKTFEDTFWPNTYERIIKHDGNLTTLVRKLRLVNVVAVLPGTDTGVLLADLVSAALNYRDPSIRTNGILRARKDKYEMQEKIKDRGLDSIRQILTSDVEESLRWVHENNLFDGPNPGVVVKPLSSAGGDGVYFPTNDDHIRRAFRKVLKKTDGLGNQNVKLLTQEMLTGVEYVPNSTIWDGRIVYTDIWEYHKRTTPSGRLIYDYDLLLPYRGKLQNELRDYDRKVLKALGIKYGNSHSEIKMVEGRGPVLIEMNNRPMGSTSPALAKFATGRSQIELTAMALTNPRAFHALPTAYTLRRNAIAGSIANLYGRKMRLKADAREKLRRLPGFFRDLLHVEPGAEVSPTEDLFNSVGEVWFLHEDLDVLLRSIDELHAMERNGELFSYL